MASVKLPRYTGPSRYILLRRALNGRRTPKTVKDDQKTAAMCSAVIPQFNGECDISNENPCRFRPDGVYDGGLYSSYCTNEFLMETQNREYHPRRLGYSWRISWCLKMDSPSSTTVVFRIRSYYPLDFKYDMVFHASIKRGNAVLLKKDFLFNMDTKDQEMIIDLRTHSKFPSHACWTEIQVFGQISVKNVGAIWNDVSTEHNFLRSERPHDRILVIGGHRFHVLSDYLATWSGFFKRLFFAKSRAAGQIEFVIDGVNNHEFFDLLSLIYPAKAVAINGSNYHYLLELADRFKIDFVISMCEKYLSSFEHRRHMPMIERLGIADNYNLNGLLKSCCQWLDRCHHKEIVNFLENHQSQMNSFSKRVRVCITEVIQTRLSNINSVETEEKW